MKATTQKTARLFRDAFGEWWGKDPFRESAVIAYYAIFSLPGLLILASTVAVHFFGRDVVSAHLHGQIGDAMGRETADHVQNMMDKAGSRRSSVGATSIGIATILVGATGVFVHLQKSLNVIWDVAARPSNAGIWTFLKARLFSFGLVLTIAFLLLVSLVITSILAAMSRWVETHWPDYILAVFQTLNSLVTLSIISVLFALMFKLLPDANIRWRYAWVGAFVTALLFEVGKFWLGFYLGNVAPGSGYGAAGSLISILLWVSYSSMIVLYGAEFTKAYAKHCHGSVATDENAVNDIN